VADRYTIRWSKTAEDDLSAILDYVAQSDGADRALALYDDVRRHVSTLSSLPRRARAVPELKALGLEAFRELLAGPYRICFRLDGRIVVLLAALDGRRDHAEFLVERALRGDADLR
jgi:plasmid stabilization system protein ParE